MSTLVTKNVTIDGRRTSIRLEPEMWDGLAEICERESKSAHVICTDLWKSRGRASLTGAVRVFIMTYFRDAATNRGHTQAGHGG